MCMYERCVIDECQRGIVGRQKSDKDYGHRSVYRFNREFEGYFGGLGVASFVFVTSGG
jgi:hypothetical protein